jgi:hypothetical protein
MFLLITPETNILFLFANFIRVFCLIAFTIGRPWKKPFFVNIPFMIVLLFSLTYSSIIVMVPEARLSVFGLDFMHFDSLNGFILGMSWAFGMFIFLLKKLVMEPFSFWIRNKYPEKTWL